MSPKYHNWIPTKLLLFLWILSLSIIAVTFFAFAHSKSIALQVVMVLISAVSLFFSLIMTRLRFSFSYRGGRMMYQIHYYVLDKLKFKGSGSLLDIGCGSGALSILAGRRYPNAQIQGIDNWSNIWEYNLKGCIQNAQIEGTPNVSFKVGDALRLDFDDETFDGVVSNFVFHEVRKCKDKRDLIFEALRVLKPGGRFAFHDLFEDKDLYGNMDNIVKELKESGIQEISYVPHTEDLPFVPKSVKVIYRNLGILYGTK